MTWLDEPATGAVTPANGRRWATTLAATALFNTAIAGLLTTVGFGQSFAVNLLFSQCIGLTICLCVSLGMTFVREAGVVSKALVLAATLGAGALAGTALGTILVGRMATGLGWESGFFLRVAAISVLFGLIITYFFHSRQQLATAAERLSAERIKRLAGEKQILQADLKRLQAQIEPHFLFNTLSNILSLMEMDQEAAKAMQLNLIHYLRTALGRSREATTTLAQEAELLRAYLEIYKIRMGERLDYTITIPSELGAQRLPPLLLQPLVENALIHGLEPKIAGGRIAVRAERKADWLEIAVVDDGMGLAEGKPPGVGLTNIRERLEHLYDPPGRLRLEDRRIAGLRVVLAIPMDGAAAATSPERRDHLPREAATDDGST